MTDNPAAIVPMAHTERDLAQAEADEWRSEFLDALRGMHTTERKDEARGN